MRIVEPIEITDLMVSSSFTNEVLEGDFAEFAIGTTYASGDYVQVSAGYGLFAEPLNQTATYWTGITSTVDGNIYACRNTTGGQYIYMMANGDDTFRVVQGSVAKIWEGMCTDPITGDVYASCYSSGALTGDIYKQTGGRGAFASMSQADRQYMGMCATPDGAIWVAVYGGDLYKLVAGTFTAQSIGNKNWSGMCAAPNGDIYAAVANGDIWVSTDDGASFSAIADTDRYWYGLVADPEGNIWASTNTGAAGGIYKRTGGAGTFAATSNSTSRLYSFMGIDLTNNDLLVSTFGDIYRSIRKTDHKIYQSLVDSNLGYYPPTDVLATTPKWLEISATNKWKVFDGKVNDQMVKVSPAVYKITPGVAFNSVVLLNVEATSVTIAVDAPAYSQTVSTGATDIVKMDLAGGVASVLTITITNSAAAAKCGEIVVGNYYELGTMKPLPTVGIVDYSVKTQDEWGDWTIVEREYSEKMNCQVNVTYSSVDAVVAKLKDYRATLIVWIGNSSYVCTILYGYWKDWSIPVATRGKAILSIEIMGVK